jgi:hypothetical protein
MESTRFNERFEASDPSRSLDEDGNRNFSTVRHLRWFGHGKPWTLIAIFVSWAGVVLSAYSRNSLHFVTLKEPLLIDPTFDYVNSIGMVRMQVCYNETVVGLFGCQVIDLSPQLVNDSHYFEAARILHTLGLWFGIFFTVVLSTAIYWESINLRPICLGLLFTYCCQCCAMLFFGTDLCAVNECRPGAGCIYCIVASFCWITACGATARMDAIKSGHARRRRRRALRKANIAAKAIRKKRRETKAIRKKRDRETKAIRKKLERETSSATEQTTSTSSSNSSQHTADIESGEDNELQIKMRNVQLNRNASSPTEKTTSESTSISAIEQTASTSSNNSSQHTADIESGEDNEIQIEMRNVQLNRNASSATEKTTSESASISE